MKGELLKLSGSLMLVHGADVPELAGEVTTVLGWCDSALTKHSENKRVRDCGWRNDANGCPYRGVNLYLRVA